MYLLWFVCTNGTVQSFCMLTPQFSSQLWHRRDILLLVSCRERTERAGKGCRLSYEHMGKKHKDLLLNSIGLWWFISPADQVLNLQKQTAKVGLGQLEQIQLCNSHSAPVWPQASFAKAAATTPVLTPTLIVAVADVWSGTPVNYQIPG